MLVFADIVDMPKRCVGMAMDDRKRDPGEQDATDGKEHDAPHQCCRFRCKPSHTSSDTARFFPWKQLQESQLASNAVLAGVILDNTDRTPVIPAMRHLGLVKAATNVFGYSPGSQPLTGTSPANETGSADDLPPLSLRIPSEGFGEREGALGHKCLGEYRPQHGTDIDSGMWPVSTVTDRIGLSRSQSSLPCDRA